MKKTTLLLLLLSALSLSSCTKDMIERTDEQTSVAYSNKIVSKVLPVQKKFSSIVVTLKGETADKYVFKYNKQGNVDSIVRTCFTDANRSGFYKITYRKGEPRSYRIKNNYEDLTYYFHYRNGVIAFIDNYEFEDPNSIYSNYLYGSFGELVQDGTTSYNFDEQGMNCTLSQFKSISYGSQYCNYMKYDDNVNSFRLQKNLLFYLDINIFNTLKAEEVENHIYSFTKLSNNNVTEFSRIVYPRRGSYYDNFKLKYNYDDAGYPTAIVVMRDKQRESLPTSLSKYERLEKLIIKY
jgi:hypothetical protein